MNILTPAEISLILKIPKRAVYQLIKLKRLLAVRVGRRLRVLDSDLNAYLQDLRERGA